MQRTNLRRRGTVDLLAQRRRDAIRVGQVGEQTLGGAERGDLVGDGEIRHAARPVDLGGARMHHFDLAAGVA